MTFLERASLLASTEVTPMLCCLMGREEVGSEITITNPVVVGVSAAAAVTLPYISWSNTHSQTLIKT